MVSRTLGTRQRCTFCDWTLMICWCYGVLRSSWCYVEVTFMISCGYATFFLHLHTHTRHATLGWGGVANNVQVYFHTHTHVMLRYCTFFLHLHTHTSYYATARSSCTCAHTSCYATARSPCTCTQTSCCATSRSSCTCTHTSCYATARSSCTCTQTSCYVGVGWGGLRSRLGKEVGHPLHSPLACIWLKYFIEHV